MSYNMNIFKHKSLSFEPNPAFFQNLFLLFSLLFLQKTSYWSVVETCKQNALSFLTSERGCWLSTTREDVTGIWEKFLDTHFKTEKQVGLDVEHLQGEYLKKKKKEIQ